jgi:hypothetical protein
MRWRANRYRRRGPARPQRIAAAGGLALVLAPGALLASLLPASPTPGGPGPGRPIPAGAVPAASRPAGQSRPVSPSHPAALGAPLVSGLVNGPSGPRTSCVAVAHIGDSTSVGLLSPASLPRRAQRLPARYAAVGVTQLRVDASGGRSIVEKLPGQVNGYRVAVRWRDHGYRGCWVIALGTNDTANVAVGSVDGRGTRIAAMMSAAHGQPVLWVNTRTVRTGGPWSEANMRSWNRDLLRACARYPNLRIFDWSSAARRSWYLADGIHYTRAGYAARARDIAVALARAFPAGGASARCVVR